MRRLLLASGVLIVLLLIAAGVLMQETESPVSTDGNDVMAVTASSARSSARNTTGLPLSLPPGFSIDVFARNLPGVRVIIRDRSGNFWVSQPSQGTVTMLEVQDGTVRNQNAVFRNLRRPHGLAIDPTGSMLYIAEEHRIARVALNSDDTLHTVYALPPAGRHFTRTIGFGPDGRLYVSVGSTCDVCVEGDERNGTILSMEPDGTDARIVARGLRNAVFFAWDGRGRLWATEMGRDNLGDDLPPDEVNLIEEGKHYGWPWCYGNRVRDTTFRPGDTYDCSQTQPPVIELPAHGAPLGLAFAPPSWLAGLASHLLVALHGSWNRSVPIGYDVVHIGPTAAGKPGVPQDFVTGWLASGGVSGRPVDLLVTSDGALLITDDKAGAVYKMKYGG
ncbi:MAG: PQQ-dependent sugar dehydrogenase [Candidatus Peribacteraceae bacterium]|nr:PQQ-dependent sugar dehydrogenase [Candidatus Peribacteraceae bacterium]